MQSTENNTPNIKIVQRNITLSESEKNYILEKMKHLTRFKLVQDESSYLTVTVELHHSKSTGSEIDFSAHFNLPQHKEARAEVQAQTVTEATDLAHDKLKHQLEKLTDKSK